MKKVIIGASAILALACCGAFYLPGGSVEQMAVMGLHPQTGAPQRLVVLAPSLVETLFVIGAGSQIRGVSSLCHYPDAAKKLPAVGGFYDPNYEAILSLHPDLVLLLPEVPDQRAQLQKLGIPSLTLEQHSLAGLVSSFLILGNLCHREAQGVFWAAQYRDWLALIRQRTRVLPKVKTLLVLGRDYSRNPVSSVYAVGRGEIYDELLIVAGGRNAVTAPDPKYPQLGVEGMLALDPDVIIELVPESDGPAKPPAELLKAWAPLTGLRAVRTHRVMVLTGDYLTIPGPRLINTLQALGKALHPEMDWNLPGVPDAR
ncbi:MAG: ABC transporter substrate-binding protein [Candidatus Firestonebacteria bacterium]|nr:ABC transporter substrate-binding protein [Candidatus Firestonebacteria bacterium]